jgi:hypothetical protein
MRKLHPWPWELHQLSLSNWPRACCKIPVLHDPCWSPSKFCKYFPYSGDVYLSITSSHFTLSEARESFVLLSLEHRAEA